eukprot:TRINITY_DN60_c0_g1_i1.p1 TRINITY_DN60_c0_g1~~TRINITY_DN60_c0_g1_i1.p1  ORF type:complete len:182 (-),score=53.87 TRINITY_DN60_c0_g1_i1:48-593(-)
MTKTLSFLVFLSFSLMLAQCLENVPSDINKGEEQLAPETSVRDLMVLIEAEMRKDSSSVDAEKLEEQIGITTKTLEENFLMTIQSLRGISEIQWKDLNIPLGISTKIKEKLTRAMTPEKNMTPEQKAKQRPANVLVVQLFSRFIGFACYFGSGWLVLRYYNFWSFIAAVVLFLFGSLLIFR